MKQLKNKKIIFILLISSILLFSMTVVSNAVGKLDASISKTTVTVGETFTVTATASSAAGTYSVSANNSNVSITNSQSGFLDNNSETWTFKAEKAGTTTVTVKATDMTDADNDALAVNGSKTFTVTVKAKETTPANPDNGGNNSGNNGGTTTPPPAEKSKEAKLSNLGITPNDFSGFKKDKYEYSTEVPNSVSKVKIYANPVKGANVISGAGEVSLKEGDNEFAVTVKAEAGNTQDYKIKIKRRTAAEDEALAVANTAESSNADLKKLGIKPGEYDFSGFQKDKTEYSAEVPNEVEEIEIYAEAANSKAQINGIGMISLEEGKNTINVEVIAEDGNKKTYVIEVTRKESEGIGATNNKVDFGLSSLEIKGLKLNPSFKIDEYEYSVELNEDLETLEILVESEDKDATIEIMGNENLQQGENTITILVQNEETDETATYQIIVNKNVINSKEEMSWLKPSTWGKEEIIKIVIIAVLIILIIVAIILKVKIAKEKKEDKKVDLPGGDELDKAIAEHQELTELDEQDEEKDVEGNEEQPEEQYEQDYIDFRNNTRKRGKHF